MFLSLINRCFAYYRDILSAPTRQAPDGLESSNFTGLLASMSCCAPLYFGLSPLDHVWVITLERLKFYTMNNRFCGTHKSTTIMPRVLKLHNNVAQHELLCTSILWIIFPWLFLSYCSWNIEILHNKCQILRHALVKNHKV